MKHTDHMDHTNVNRRLIGTLVAVLLLSAALALMAQAGSAGVREVGGEAFVFAFDPQGETFPFSYTLPTEGAHPQDVVALTDGGQTEVWIAETGADRIGRLTYTESTTYQYQAYDLAAGSEPLSLLAHDGFIWFTAAGADAVGRLDPDTEAIAIFDVGAGTYPADLVAGPEGHVWFTQMMADQVAQLVVTSTIDYQVTTYTDALLTGGRPRGIALSGISFYVAQTENGRVSIFTPPDSWIHMPASGSPIVLEEPYGLAVDGDDNVWGTERTGNRVNQYGVYSFPEITRYPVSPDDSEPTAIAVDPSDKIWFTQYAAGRIGQLDPEAATGEEQTSYDLPQDGLAPAGIASDGQGTIWVVASVPVQRIYLPLVLRGS